jgi:recombination protein RecT
MSNSATLAPAANTTPVPAEAKGKITTQVLKQISDLQNRGVIVLPDDYIPGNAVNSAWLKLQEVTNKDGKPIFQNGQLTNVVTLESVANALHNYVIQGLNVAKNQCYFIVYGDKLTMQRSYFGDMALAQRILPGITFNYDVILAGEEFLLEKIRTNRGLITTIGKHTLRFPRPDEEIIGAYVEIVNAHGEVRGVDYMDIARIKKSWGMSKTYNPNGNGPHNKFASEMCLRTVIRHACKEIFNASSDAELMKSIRASDAEAAIVESNEEFAPQSNGATLALSAPAEQPTPVPQVQAAPPVSVPVETVDEGPGF